jgi:hypothetical protein
MSHEPPRPNIPAYLINPETKTIEAVSIDASKEHLPQIYAHLGCNLVTTAPLAGSDTVYVDDEGLIKGPVYQFFGLQGYSQPLAGRGLVVGSDGDGNDVAPALSLDEVKGRLFFIERLTRDLWSIRQAGSHAMEVGPLAHIERTLGGEAIHGH